MGALRREKLSNRHGSSLFHHVLNDEDSVTHTGDEEVQERNFRDLEHVMVPAWMYVHLIFSVGFNFITTRFSRFATESRYVLVDHMWFMPECDNTDEVRMLGIYPPHYYCEFDIEIYTMDELVDGEHLILGNEYYAIRGDFLDFYFLAFCRVLQMEEEDENF